MEKPLLVVYSSLGLGGIPTRLVEIVNEIGVSAPDRKIYILLKKKNTFDRRLSITNKNVVVKDFNEKGYIFTSFVFIIWVWCNIYVYNPQSILTFISPFSIPVLLTKIIFFWRTTKIVINEGHFTSTMIQGMYLPFVQNIGIRFLYPLSNCIIVPTRAIKEDLHNNFGISTNLITIIPNWSRYALVRLQKQKKSIDLIYLGRIDKKKRILELLSIVKYLLHKNKLDLVFKIFGDGPAREECVQFIKVNKLSKNIQLYFPTNEVINNLRKSKILVLNSEKKSEGFPLAILDAMSSGTIVVSKRFSGVEDVIVNNTNGFIVDSDKDMYECIKHILHDYYRFKRIIMSAKRYVRINNSPNNIILYIRYLNV